MTQNKSGTDQKGQVAFLGIDLSKKSFQLHGVDAKGHVVIKKKLTSQSILALYCQSASMRFVSTKTIEQQDIQSLDRIRSQAVARRTALGNQVRGLLMEYGVIIPKDIAFIRKQFLTAQTMKVRTYVRRINGILSLSVCAGILPGPLRLRCELLNPSMVRLTSLLPLAIKGS
ncbi:hypothetical protein [Endozoicomonas acroporae]|uniref:hypothetical protein n=2 Tax=Endozoicomonas TaxID=305899 RepID=UPI003D7BB156